MKRMKKWFTIALLLTVLCSLTVSVWATEERTQWPAHEVNEVVFATSPVNIRTGPGTDYPIIGTLRTGKSIRRMALGEDGWSQVMYGDQTAYIHSSYLTSKLPSGTSPATDPEELMHQLAVANGLNAPDYTLPSWEAVAAAMDFGNAALAGSSQSCMDEAANMLAETVAALVRMDYTSLEKALSEMQALGKENVTSALWLELMEAGEKGRSLLASGDQAAVDAVAQQLNGLLKQLRELSAVKPDPQVVVQEVPVEVPPTEDFCNISGHWIWKLVFFLSAALNVALLGIIWLYLWKKKRKQRDHTPLVAYDIFDDEKEGR